MATRCDICEKKDGYQDFVLKTCAGCGVSVHDSCYGFLPKDAKHKPWTCFACRYAKENNVKRPTDCALCSVNDGVHAMHPLYDDSGRIGRQRGKQIGWVHTLCALFVGTNPITAGTVFVCDKNGRYDGFEYNSDDDSTVTEDSDDDSKESINTDFSPLHHFVMCNVNENSIWSRAICESRNLRCIYCGQPDNDKNKPSLRIPIQCAYGNDNEMPTFRKRIIAALGNTVVGNCDSCVVAMHVGCARWMDRNAGYQRVYFYPGESRPEKLDDPNAAPDALCFSYCDAHAKLIRENKPKSNSNSNNQTNNQRQSQLQALNPKRHKLGPTTAGTQNKKVKTIISTTSVVSERQKEIAETIVKYVCQKLKAAENQKGAKEIDVTSEAKNYWKTKLVLGDSSSNTDDIQLSVKVFKEIWNIVKSGVQKKLENPWKSLWMPEYEMKSPDEFEWFR